MNHNQKNQKKRKRRRLLLILFITLALLLLAGYAGWRVMIYTPGERYTGPIPSLGDKKLADRVKPLADELQADVRRLAEDIGQRNLEHYQALIQAADHIESQLTTAGYSPNHQQYEVLGKVCSNIEAERVGGEKSDQIVLVGAHYDSVFGSPGANDNASGVAAMLALARRFAHKKCARTLRFVAFVNEEPPYFQTPVMGSRVYAKRCRQRKEQLVAVLSLETIGYYQDEPGTQNYPAPFGMFYPSTGNFIGVVGNVGSRPLVHRVIRSFRASARFPAEGGAIYGAVPGVGWSDHWAFWQEGYQGVMITDTAPFRYPYYHTAEDTPDKLDFEQMALVVDGLESVINELAGE